MAGYVLVICPACGGRWGDPSDCKPCHGTGKLTPEAAAPIAARLGPAIHNPVPDPAPAEESEIEEMLR